MMSAPRRNTQGALQSRTAQGSLSCWQRAKLPVDFQLHCCCYCYCYWSSCLETGSSARQQAKKTLLRQQQLLTVIGRRHLACSLTCCGCCCPLPMVPPCHAPPPSPLIHTPQVQRSPPGTSRHTPTHMAQRYPPGTTTQVQCCHMPHISPLVHLHIDQP